MKDYSEQFSRKLHNLRQKNCSYEDSYEVKS